MAEYKIKRKGGKGKSPKVKSKDLRKGLSRHDKRLAKKRDTSKAFTPTPKNVDRGRDKTKRKPVDKPTGEKKTRKPVYRPSKDNAMKEPLYADGVRSVKKPMYFSGSQGVAGYQDVTIPPAGGAGDVFSGLVGGTSMGGNIGSAIDPLKGGPWGMAIGAGVGLVKGIDDMNQANWEHNQGLDRRDYVEDLNKKTIDPRFQKMQAENGLDVNDGTKDIEVERDELIFKRNGRGKYMLKADFKGGRPHKKGGEDYTAEEGDVIFPGRDRKKVLKAYNSNDNLSLEDMRSKLPKDEEVARYGSEYDGGTRGIDPPYQPYIGIQDYNDPIQVGVLQGQIMDKFPQAQADFNTLYGDGDFRDYNFGPLTESYEQRLKGYQPPGDAMSPRGAEANSRNRIGGPITSLNPYGEIDPNFDGQTNIDFGPGEGSSTYPVEGAGAQGGGFDVNQALTSAPAIYDLGMGLFGDTEQANRRYLDPEEMEYQDLSDPLRRQALENRRVQERNIGETRSSRGQQVGYMGQVGADYLKQQGAIDTGEIGRQEQINKYNLAQRNQAAQTNLGLAQQYDQFDAASRGKKQDFLRSGIEQTAEDAMVRRKEGFARSRDARLDANDQLRWSIANEISGDYSINASPEDIELFRNKQMSAEEFRTKYPRTIKYLG